MDLTGNKRVKMNRENNIFCRLTKGDENSITELLVNLMGHKYFRDDLLELFSINKKVAENIDFDHITTQLSYGDIGRPDIIIENEECIVFIENKINKSADLQQSQITTYPEEIKERNKNFKKLLFLVPKNYCHINKIMEISRKYDFIHIIYWEDVITYIHKKEYSKNNPVIMDAVRFIEGKIIHEDYQLIFTSREIAYMYTTRDLIESNKLLLKMPKIIQDCDDYIFSKINKNIFQPSDHSHDKNGIGKYIKYNSNFDRNIFYGLCFALVEAKPEADDYIFSLSIREDILEENKIADLDSVKSDDWYYFKVSKTAITSQNPGEEIGKEIMAYFKKLFP